MDREPVFAQLDALIAAGWGDHAQNDIPKWWRERSPQDLCLKCQGAKKRNRIFCSAACAVSFGATQRRRVDPKKLRELHLIRWLPRKETARLLGVTIAAINSATQRHGLGRRLTHCRIQGCTQPIHKKKHVFGYYTGTLCLKHTRAAQREYQRKARRKRSPLLSAAARSEKARAASVARWSGTTPEQRKEFIRGITSKRCGSSVY